MSTFGIEEEFFLLEQATYRPATPDPATARSLLAIGAESGGTQQELLACQVENATPVCTTAVEADFSLSSYRDELARTAAKLGMIPISCGTLPSIPAGAARISDNERYRRIQAFAPGICDEQYISGLHVHVSIPDAESGIAALNSLRRWLPLLAALGSNSPYWRGEDTGFASWRTIRYRQWSVQGIQPYFENARDYYKRLAAILASDVVLDSGHISWAARLSSRYPTVEVRVADAQLKAGDSVLLALIVRALVEASRDEAPVGDNLMPETLDLALWQSAKHGLVGPQLDPVSRHRVTARTAVETLLKHITPALAANNDTVYVTEGLDRLLRTGTGAERQRRSFAQGGLSQVILDAGRELTSGSAPDNPTAAPHGTKEYLRPESPLF